MTKYLVTYVLFSPKEGGIEGFGDSVVSVRGRQASLKETDVEHLREALSVEHGGKRVVFQNIMKLGD